jgi:hypothetical protein
VVDPSQVGHIVRTNQILGEDLSMSSPFNSGSQRFSQYNAAQGAKQNADASYRAMRNHQASRGGGGGGGGIGGLLAVGFLILIVLVALGVIG